MEIYENSPTLKVSFMYRTFEFIKSINNDKISPQIMSVIGQKEHVYFSGGA